MYMAPHDAYSDLFFHSCLNQWSGFGCRLWLLPASASATSIQSTHCADASSAAPGNTSSSDGCRSGGNSPGSTANGHYAA